MCRFLQPTAARTGNKCTFRVFAWVVRYDLTVKSRYKNGYISLWWSIIDIQYNKYFDLRWLQVPFSSQNLDMHVVGRLQLGLANTLSSVLEPVRHAQLVAIFEDCDQVL